MTDEPKDRISDLDRWVIGALTLISLALIAASVITGDTIYLASLGGPATFVVLYFLFFR